MAYLILLRPIFCIGIFIFFTFNNESPNKLDETYEILVKNGIDFTNIPFRLELFIKISIFICILNQSYSYYIGSYETLELEYSHWIGLILVIFGFFLSRWAMKLLGKYFVYAITAREHQELITTGPYRIFAHPFYSGMLIFLCGTSLVFDNWLVSISTLLYMILFGILLGEEETGMELKFGEKYVKYKSERYKIIPYFF